MEKQISITPASISTQSGEIIMSATEEDNSMTDAPSTTEPDTEVIEYTIKEFELDEPYRSASAIEANECQAL